MINKPKVGIIKRQEENNFSNYVKAVNLLGGIAITIPNYDAKILKEVLKCDGIIFTGGTSWEMNDEKVLKYCLDNKMPFLGICLGMQMIGDYFSYNHEVGIDKTVKINTGANHNCNNKYCHEVILKNGFLSNLFNKDKILVNSYHNYIISNTDSSIIKGYSDDGVIEALEIQNHPFGIGVQWHPEKIIDDVNSKLLFGAFIDSCKYYSKVKNIKTKYH